MPLAGGVQLLTAKEKSSTRILSWLAALPLEQRTAWPKSVFAAALGAAGLTLARDEWGRDVIVGRSIYARIGSNAQVPPAASNDAAGGEFSMINAASRPNRPP